MTQGIENTSQSGDRALVAETSAKMLPPFVPTEAEVAAAGPARFRRAGREEREYLANREAPPPPHPAPHPPKSPSPAAAAGIAALEGPGEFQPSGAVGSSGPGVESDMRGSGPGETMGAGIGGEGRKNDDGKSPWHLVPFDAVRSVVDVLQHGAEKYGPRNWERGMDWDRLFSAAMRHMTAWYDGEELDEETGSSHLAHAVCCLLFLLAYQLRGVGRDARPRQAR